MYIYIYIYEAQREMTGICLLISRMCAKEW